MTELKLTVINALRHSRLVPGLSQDDFPAGIAGTIREYDESPIAPEKGSALLLITDDAALAVPTSRDAFGEVYVVFIGDVDHLAEDGAAFEDVWNPSDGGEVLKRRYIKLLGHIRDRFEARFYKRVLKTTIDTVPDILWFKRLDGIHMLVNNAFAEIVHKPKDDVIGKDHFYIWDAPRPADGNAFACAESEEIAISTGKTYICDEPVTTRDGMKQLTTYKTPIYDPLGNVFGTVGVGHDVTNFSNLGIELSILIENMPFPMTIFAPDWSVVRMNKYFKEIVGAEHSDSFDYRQWKATTPLPTGEVTTNAQRHTLSQEYQIEVGGETRNFILTELEIRDFFDNVSGHFCTLQDITYQRAYEQSIIKAANTDMLTGMYNRRYIYNFLNDFSGKPFYLLYLDLDNFKAVNDRYGHKVGDEVLVRAAELINKHFPKSVTSRLGGDEFAVVEESDSLEALEARSQALEAAVRESFASYGCGTSVSIGIVYSDGTVDDIDKLFQMGDRNMYIVKTRHHEG